MVRARRNRPGGFTLIELLVAMALSTVGLLGLVALQSIAVRGNMMSRNFGEAIGIAQQQLETAQRTPYTSLSTLQGTASNVSPTPDTLSTQAIYTRTTAVVDNGDNTTTVTVTVAWTDLNPTLPSHSVVLVVRRSP
jgi:prepilin-type N-terminal cleavage/methylation domain-containing protein